MTYQPGYTQKALDSGKRPVKHRMLGEAKTIQRINKNNR